MARRDRRPRITGGRWAGRALLGGVPAGARPTPAKAREALGSILLHRWEGAQVLDGFAGAGALSAEAVSRGAARVVACDVRAHACAAIQRTLWDLGAEEIVEVRRADLLKHLRSGPPPPSERFDLVFLDPPYGSGLASRALDTLVAMAWLAPGCRVVVEVRRGEPLPNAAPPVAFLGRRRYGDTVVGLYEHAPGASETRLP